MQMGIRLFVLILLLPSVVVSAQKGRVLAATEQCWSGGIAGRHGCNYNFTVAFNNVSQIVMADTIWIGNYPVKLTERTSKGVLGNMTLKREKKRVIFDINVRTQFNDYEKNIMGLNNSEGALPKSPETDGAVAVMCYWYGGKRRYFAVPKILRRRAPVAYP